MLLAFNFHLSLRPKKLGLDVKMHWMDQWSIPMKICVNIP